MTEAVPQDRTKTAPVLPALPQPGLSNQRWQLLHDLATEGFSNSSIANILGFTINTIESELKAIRASGTPIVRIPSNVDYMLKLVWNAAIIAANLKAGVVPSSLCECYGRSEAWLYAVALWQKKGRHDAQIMLGGEGCQADVDRFRRLLDKAIGGAK